MPDPAPAEHGRDPDFQCAAHPDAQRCCLHCFFKMQVKLETERNRWRDEADALMHTLTTVRARLKTEDEPGDWVTRAEIAEAKLSEIAGLL